MDGWITLHRKLLDKPIWHESTPEQKVILITLMLMANHKEKQWEWQGRPYKAKPGQFVTSINSIVERCGKGVSAQNVRTALKRFEKYEFLTNQSTKQNRLITIVNWGFYQDMEQPTNKATNRQLTDDQQTANSQLTTNNIIKHHRRNAKLAFTTRRQIITFSQNGYSNRFVRIRKSKHRILTAGRMISGK